MKSVLRKFLRYLARRLRRAARDIRVVCLLLNQPVPESLDEICEGEPRKR